MKSLINKCQLMDYLNRGSAIVAASLLIGCKQQGVNTPPPPRIPSVLLGAPSATAPPDQSVFTNYPRTIHFQWGSVPQAATYAIEIDCKDCCETGRWCSDVQGTGYIVPDLKTAEYDFNFWGNQRGRWRVWAVDGRSQPGPKCAWSDFLFTSAGTAHRTAPFDAPRPPRQQIPSPAGTTGEMYSRGPGVVPPKPIYAPTAEYSDTARRRRISGEVLMEIVVNVDGSVGEARILRSVEPGLDANSLEAVKTWRFQPAMKDGRAVAIRIRTSMTFQLQ